MKVFPEFEQAMKLITTEAINVTTTGKAYIDDAKLTDHHAIIPTGKMVDPATLNEDQRKIYLLVAKRFLSIFLPPYKVAATTVLLDCNGESILAKGREIIDKGFSILYQDKSKDIILPNLESGDIVKVSKPVLNGLVARGITVAIDDFGVDASNLNSLGLPQFSVAKLDKSLIDQAEHSDRMQLVIKTAVELCHDLNMLCVAEGIETDNQIELLKKLGCDRLQGYLIGKPMPAADFFHQFGEAALHKNRKRT